MKKVMLLTASLICAQLTTHAQLRFGVTGGLQSSKLQFSATRGSASINTSGLFGGHVGVVAERTISDNFSIQPELLLSFKGGSIKDGSDSYKMNLTYLELPLQVIYKPEIGPGRLLVGAGTYVGYMLSGKADDEEIEVGEDLKGFDSGFRLLGGYEPNDTNLSVKVFYNFGLSNISPESALTIKNSTFGLSLSYFFGER